MNSRLPLIMLFATGMVLTPRMALAKHHVLSITEISRSGKQTLIDDQVTGYSIFDINGTMQIAIDTGLIRSVAAKSFSIQPPVDTILMNALSKVLQKETEIYSQFGSSSESLAERKRKLGAFSADMIGIDTLVMKIPDLRARIDSLMGLSLDGQVEFEQLCGLISSEIENLGRQLELSHQSVQPEFRLAGWLIDETGSPRSIHLPGFDDYNDGVFYEKPRVVVGITDADRKALEEFAAVSEAFNKDGFSPATASFVTYMKAFSDSLVGTVNCLTGQFANPEWESLLSRNSPALKEVVDSLSAMRTEFNSVQRDVRYFVDLSGRLQHFSGSLILVGSAVDSGKAILDELAPQIVALSRTANRTLEILSQVIARNTNGAVTEAMVDRFRMCVKPLSGLAEQSLPYLHSAYTFFLGPNKRDLAEAALNISSKVRAFLIGNIPSTCSVDLRHSGFRNNGDQVCIRAVIDTSHGKPEPLVGEVEVDRRTFVLNQIGFHVDYSVGVEFVHPLSTNGVTLRKYFQMAPSYSIFARFGTRSASFNDLWRPGLGISFVAPDFDQNSSPELGLGVAVALFGDFLQAGVGSNVSGDNNASYWFFGIQLPISLLVGMISSGKSN